MAVVVDISFSQGEGLAKTLSNLQPRKFIIDGVRCGSMEGFLQSLKFPQLDEQVEVAALSGFRAFKRGQEGNVWKETQDLFWRGTVYDRHGPEYQELLTRAYDAQLNWSVELQNDLLLSVGRVLRHTRGKHDSRDTVLTESEYIRQLERLRWRVLNEREVLTRIRSGLVGDLRPDDP